LNAHKFALGPHEARRDENGCREDQQDFFHG
jgi:hypothetical protein